MAQFQAYHNERSSRDRVPYLLDVQSDLVQTGTRLVVPLVRSEVYGPRYSRVNPEVEVAGETLVAAVSDLVAVDERELRETVADLSAHRQILIDALDFIFTGY
jgi:CcdB protein.